jgi:hypothetical protein
LVLTVVARGRAHPARRCAGQRRAARPARSGPGGVIAPPAHPPGGLPRALCGDRAQQGPGMRSHAEGILPEGAGQDLHVAALGSDVPSRLQARAVLSFSTALRCHPQGFHISSRAGCGVMTAPPSSSHLAGDVEAVGKPPSRLPARPAAAGEGREGPACPGQTAEVQTKFAGGCGRLGRGGQRVAWLHLLNEVHPTRGGGDAVCAAADQHGNLVAGVSYSCTVSDLL